MIIMRNEFEKQLAALKKDLITMGALCEKMILDIVKALKTGNMEYASEAGTCENEVNRIEREIEGRCMKLLLHQQPVASDFRNISAALKMVTDMERIGDQAYDIADILPYFSGKRTEEFEKIYYMAEAAAKMVTMSVDAYVNHDVELAKQVIEYDDVVDTEFDNIKTAIISMIENDRKDGELALDLLMTAKYLERIGDHATNIAEWVVYAATGIHEVEE